jgi:ParB family chromosome partitioning protein
VPIRAIVPPKVQVREDVGYLDELANSIHLLGLIHPILVRPVAGDRFEIVAGVRRFSACKLLRWTQISAIIREMGEQEAYEIALAENIQRKSMNAIEEAKAFRKYVEREGWGGMSHLAQKIGKSKSYVSQRLFLLTLPDAVQLELQLGGITPSIARQLSGIASAADQEAVATNAHDLKLSARSTAFLIKSIKDPGEFAPADFDSRYKSLSSEKNHESVRALQQAILAIRLAMAKLDILTEKCDRKDPDTARYIHELRLQLHRMIDDCIRRKIDCARVNTAE